MTDNTLTPITEQSALEDFCGKLAESDFICVDTEFHRETTYWPELCLVQASAPGVEGLIDPLAEDLDIGPFLNLIAADNRTKVFHAARQDIEIFNRLIGHPPGPVFEPKMIVDLPRQLVANQRLFTLTGGLHAAALFDETGTMLVCREDVGRHNAVDKLVGWALMANKLPLNRCVIMVSGRASYEIMQKCLVAGVPMVCAVSAPSSLSIDVAQEFGMTLVGFLRGERFNIYAGRERIAGMSA